MVFEIKVNILKYIVRHFSKRLIKLIKGTVRILSKQLIALINMQLLTDFQFFYSHVPWVERVFIKKLCDFIIYYFQAVTKLTKRKIFILIWEDVQWWNNLLSIYNEILFFDTINKETISLHMNTCSYGLEDFFFRIRMTGF